MQRDAAIRTLAQVRLYVAGNLHGPAVSHCPRCPYSGGIGGSRRTGQLIARQARRAVAIGGAEGDPVLRAVALGDGCHHLLVKSALIGPLVWDERAIWPLVHEANGTEPGRTLRHDARRGQLARLPPGGGPASHHGTEPRGLSQPAPPAAEGSQRPAHYRAG